MSKDAVERARAQYVKRFVGVAGDRIKFNEYTPVQITAGGLCEEMALHAQSEVLSALEEAASACRDVAGTYPATSEDTGWTEAQVCERRIRAMMNSLVRQERYTRPATPWEAAPGLPGYETRINAEGHRETRPIRAMIDRLKAGQG